MTLSKYIDFDQVVEEMLRNREDDRAALESLLEQQAELLADDGVRAVRYDREAVQRRVSDDALVNMVIQRELLAERIRRLQMEQEVFDKAWDRLTGEEQLVLETFYLKGMRRQDAVDLLCEQLYCEKTKVYTMKTKAVARLKHLLFG